MDQVKYEKYKCRMNQFNQKFKIINLTFKYILYTLSRSFFHTKTRINFPKSNYKKTFLILYDLISPTIFAGNVAF